MGGLLIQTWDTSVFLDCNSGSNALVPFLRKSFSVGNQWSLAFPVVKISNGPAPDYFGGKNSHVLPFHLKRVLHAGHKVGCPLSRVPHVGQHWRRSRNPAAITPNGPRKKPNKWPSARAFLLSETVPAARTEKSHTIQIAISISLSLSHANEFQLQIFRQCIECRQRKRVQLRLHR